MGPKWIIFNYSWIILIILENVQACIFYSKRGFESETTDSVRFIRVREDMHIGSDVLTLRAYPRTSIKIKGVDRTLDYRFFKIKEINETYVQVLLDKSLNDLVDRDVPQNLLKFKIECSSREGQSEETSFLVVTVYIEDINDHFPVFQNLPYSVTVEEATPVGTTIFQGVLAFDRDKPNTPNSDVQYSIGVQDFGPGGPYFSLESPHRPSVVLRRSLDYDEGLRRFSVPIIAADRGTPSNSANTTLTVVVQDNDDLPPKFTEGVYRTRIKEFSPLMGKSIHLALHFNPKIRAYDQDSLNVSLSYDIIAGNERNIFWVDPTRGSIYMEKEIDLEEESLPGNTFVLQLEARQRDNPLKRAIARVEIEILDLNDNPPEFEVDYYNISIVENLPTGFSVLQVNAIDRDQGENSEFYFTLENENPSGAFVIEPRSGWLTVRDQELLDRESRNSITMTVHAVEKQEPYDLRDIDSGKVQVEIFLLDSNDNTPEFEMGNLYEFKVDVDAPVGHVVGYVTAKDPDEGRNGMIVYELQHPRGSGTIPFKLESHSGALSVGAPLRRGRIAVFVEASDQPINPSERRFSLAVVTIEIVANTFDGSIDFVGAPYEFWVGADVPVGASIGQIRTNLGWELEGEVMYDLLHSYSEGVPFAVEERSGIVTVIRELDDFERNFYEFEAVAAHESFDKVHGQLMRRLSKSERQVTQNGEVIEIDEGVISDSENVLVTNVTIHVVNSDDERGILLRGTYADPIEFHVKENLPGAFIGQLLYQNATKPNPINERKTIIHTPKRLPMTTREMYSARSIRDSKFVRNATFKPISRRRNRDADASVYVSVLPTIEFDDLMAQETMLPNAFALPVRKKFKPKVKEVDTTEHVQYERRTTYDSRAPGNAKTPQNFENFQRTKLVSPIKDSDQSEAKMDMKNTNDELEKETEVIITPRPSSRVPKQRNLVVITPNGTHTETNQKRSIPPGNKLRYLIANQQDVEDSITITNNGTLLTIKGLDRETRDVYRLTIIAEYSKAHVSGAGIYQVTIHVDDVNDNPPLFNQPIYSGVISENCALGTGVRLNQAMLIKDADIGQNAEFVVLLSGEGSSLFEVEFVNATSLKNRTKIGNNADYKIQPNFKLDKQFQMMLVDAQSQSLPVDVPFYNIRYIGPNVLDRERENFYSLRITAKDRGGLKSEAKLGIVVSDVNDNAPIFEQIAVFKDSGAEILEFANNMDIYFVDRFNSIVDLPPAMQKKMDNGPISYRLSMPLVGHQKKVPQIDRVNVGTPRFLADTNKTTPIDEGGKMLARKGKRHNRLDAPVPFFAIAENVEVGSTVIKMTAIDDDADENARVFYEIVSETFIPKRASKSLHMMRYFSVDRLSGEIKINKPLQAESEIRLNVTAKDIGDLADFTMVKFKILDINDHAPVFERSWYTFDIDEGSYTGQILGMIRATDEDYGNNSLITYTIQSDKPIPFRISPNTGQLIVDGDLDREVKSQYEFKIIATDNSLNEKRLSSMAEIEINILDLNDNAPEFTNYDEIYYPNRFKTITDDQNESQVNRTKIKENQFSLPVYKAYLNKNTEPATFVKQITAIDRDFAGNGNGLVMYSLQHAQLPYSFEIDSRDGIITTVSKFNRFHGYEHLNLTILATDLGSPSRTSTALLLVNLQGDDMFDDDDEDEETRLFPHKYYEIEVPENNEVPMFLVQLNVSAMYRDDSFKWSIVPEMDMVRSDEFKIDSRNGSLWLVKALDRESNDVHKIKVRAERVLRESRNYPIIAYPVVDGDRIKGLQDNEIRIVVKVVDLNDNEPKFTGNGKPIIAVLPITANFGHPITRVKATDDDIGINAEIRYSLLNEHSRLFGIDSETGWIRALGPIPKNSKVYGFDVKATDRRGGDDGRSSIANVFVYILSEDKQVHLVIAGQPIDVEKEIGELIKTLSDMTDLDIRVRLIEPHLDTENGDPATDVYIYAVDPRSNAVIEMDELQSILNSIGKQNISTSAQILELAQFGNHRLDRRNFYNTINPPNQSLKAPELASIFLAVIVFAGGLSTALCVVCIRYKRRKNSTRAATLAYSLAGTPSTLRTLTKSTSSTKAMLPISHSMSSQQLYSDANQLSSKERERDRHRDRPREYIDVPLPQSVLNSTFNMDHDGGCLRYNQLQLSNQTMNVDTSVASLQSSGRDSGLDLSNGSSRKSRGGVLRESDRNRDRINAGGLRASRRKNKCMCGHADIHGCSEPDSSDSYEDSLKNAKVCRRTSLPRTQGFRRSVRINPITRRGTRHSFSGTIRDDLLQASPGLFDRQRFQFNQSSVAELENRLRNLERTFQQPFHLNNVRHP